MLDTFYGIFEDLTHWDTWYDKGYTLGFIILLTISLLFSLLYYQVFGRRGAYFASMKSWFFFGIICWFLVFLISLFVEGNLVFKLVLSEFYIEIWIFSLINAFYSLALFTLLSIGLKRFSIHSKYIPF